MCVCVEIMTLYTQTDVILVYFCGMLAAQIGLNPWCSCFNLLSAWIPSRQILCPVTVSSKPEVVTDISICSFRHLTLSVSALLCYQESHPLWAPNKNKCLHWQPHILLFPGVLLLDEQEDIQATWKENPHEVTIPDAHASPGSHWESASLSLRQSGQTRKRL